VLGIVQGFDPAGVAARSLSECLAIQAREANRYDPAMARLIDNLDLPRPRQPRPRSAASARSMTRIWPT
jgi:DNA-directed RNA polymerase specialized sigma54-like protein